MFPVLSKNLPLLSLFTLITLSRFANAVVRAIPGRCEASCGADQFQCSVDCSCIPQQQRCDGRFQCSDQSDEEDCDLKFGTDCQGFQCTLGKCLDMSLACDGKYDCGEGDTSDEDSGCASHCGSDEFACKNGQCISLHAFCDGITDCGDRSDEISCPKYEMCNSGELACRDGTCIMKTWFCDGDQDCPDFSDEEECGTSEMGCGDDQFQCNSTKRCISRQKRCDKRTDCVDASDEMGCDMERCRADQFTCNNGDCLEMSNVCNGIPDCEDSSDEKPNMQCSSGPRFNVTDCAINNGNCQHTCRYNKNLPECICQKGFRLAPDQLSCVDIDECAVEGACSQTCNNTVGSFSCSCQSGYRLSDSRSCVAASDRSSSSPADLLLSDRHDLKRLHADKWSWRYAALVKNLTNAVGLDFDFRREMVYWTDIGLDKIMRSGMRRGDVPEEIISIGLETPSGIALDWVHELLFWTDSGTQRIEVAKLDGGNRKVLIWEGLEKPRAIVVHPERSYIFWIDWGAMARLERANMDGGSRITLVSRNLQWPNGLTIDYTSDQIFWTDAKYHVIERINLDGGGRKSIITRGLPHPFGITVFEDYVYWTDWKTKSLSRANKFHGTGVKVLSSSFLQPMTVTVFHLLRQNQAPVNRCSEARCSHLCLPSPRAISCACPTGFAKTNATHCEEGIDRFLIFATNKDVRRISLVDDKKLDVVLPIKNMERVVGLDWHANHAGGLLFWSDINADRIYRSDWDGRNQKVIVSSSLDSPCGIAVDWTTEKLYWTDAGNNRIEVSLLDGSMRTILIHSGLQKPRGIAVHPESGRIVYTDWGDHPRIEVAGMDGGNRTTIVKVRIRWPNDVTIDHRTGRVYWTDGIENMIESCFLDGSDRRVLVSTGISQPFGITHDENNIYWTDWGLQSLISVDKVTGENRRVLRDKLGKNLMDVRYFHNDRPRVPSPCAIKNGGCSHLCLLATNSEQERNITITPYTCSCPSGLTLRPDKRTCASKMENYLAIARRSDIRIISLDVPYSVDVKLEIKSDLLDVVDVDVDPIEDAIYFSDIGSKTINKFVMGPNATTETIIEYGLENVEGIAVDPFSKLLYWTDAGHNWIGVSKLDGSSQRILIRNEVGSPRALAVHYLKGLLFWTDWVKERPRIERCNQDGSGRMVIVDMDITWPNGITVDRQNDRLFWCDAMTEKVEMADLDGGNRMALRSGVQHVYSISYQKGFLYWSEWTTCDVKRMQVNDTDNFRTLRRNMPSLMGISASTMPAHTAAQCANHSCSHLCLPSGTHASRCSCPTGVNLWADDRTCSELPDEYLVFTTRNAIRRLSLDTDDHTDVILPLSELKNTVALDYHYRYQMLFYTDIERGVMVRSFLNATNPTVITSERIKTAEGLAVDWIADNLYWTDTHYNAISVSRLDGSYRKTLINESLDEPRAIAIHPVKGLMFWTDWGKVGKIERSFLDGSDRKVVISNSIGWPNGLTIDYDTSKVFWVDAKDTFDHIETCELDGSHRKVVVQNVPHGFSLSLLREHLYWTDWTTSNVHTSMEGGRIATLYMGERQQLMDIKAVSSHRQRGTNACDARNDERLCRYLCLMRGESDYVCVLPDGEVDNRDPYLIPLADLDDGHNATHARTVSASSATTQQQKTTTTATTVASTVATTTSPLPTTTHKVEETSAADDVVVSALPGHYPPSTSNSVVPASRLVTQSNSPAQNSIPAGDPKPSDHGGVDITQLVLIAVVAFVVVAAVVSLFGCLIVRGRRKETSDAIIYFQNPTYSINNSQAQTLLNSNGSGTTDQPSPPDHSSVHILHPPSPLRGERVEDERRRRSSKSEEEDYDSCSVEKKGGVSEEVVSSEERSSSATDDDGTDDTESSNAKLLLDSNTT